MNEITTPTVPPKPATPGGYEPPILVLGLGNDMLSDDAAGLRIARRVRVMCAGWRDIAVRETPEMGLSLLDEIVGCETLLLVDAIVTGGTPVGYLHEYAPATLPTSRTGTPHFLGVMETLGVGERLGYAMPHRLRIFALEVAEPFAIGTELTPKVAAAIDPAAVRVAGYSQSLLVGTV